MSVFKRIFGKGDQESDKKVDSALEQIQKGEITKIYPILKPGNWVGVQAGALKQTIVGSQQSPELVVAFGYDTPSNFIFLMPKDLEGRDVNQLLMEAYDNLESVKIDFEPSSTFDNKVLTASGHDFSSEKILSQSHMLLAHKLLNTDELLVSIPRRRCMMVTSRNESKEILNSFVALHNNAWNDESYGNAPIINALFVVKEGRIDGLIDLNK